MRTMLAATLLFATVAASADDMTFDQASALAGKDSATLNVDQVSALAESESKASTAVRAHCPEPVHKDDFASFTVIMEIDASGKITRTWLKGSTKVAICFNEGMSHRTLVKPPHAPFYAAWDQYWQQ
jgi:hypothetical protein